MLAFEDLAARLHATGRSLIVCGAPSQPRALMERSGFADRIGQENLCNNVLAALARNYARPQGLMGEERVTANGEEQGGIFSTIVEAVVKGVVQEATRQLKPKRRRRRTTSIFSTRTRRRTRKKRSGTPSLDQIFGEILGTLRR